MRPSFVARLEVELRGQLDLSGRGIAAQSRSQNAGGRGYRLDDLPEPRARNVAYRLVEVGVIQNVKEFSAELEVNSFRDHKRAIHGEVDIE